MSAIDWPRVDNHPKYNNWVRAMDELRAAAENLETVRYLPEDNPVKQAARAEVGQAQCAYEDISREIGY